MKQLPRMSISESEYLRRRRRVIALSVFTVLLGVANMLWGCYRSTKGIQSSDYVAAALLAVLLASACYAGWRLAVRRLTSLEPPAGDQASITSATRASDGEA